MWISVYTAVITMVFACGKTVDKYVDNFVKL